MDTENAIKPVTADEATTHLVFVKRALDATTELDRNQALIDEILAFGHRALFVWHELSQIAPDNQKDFYRESLDVALDIYVRWIKGGTLTRRPDEPERRALAGLSMLRERPDLLHLHHYAAQAILHLPDGHPLRDTELAKKSVLAELDWFLQQEEPGEWLALSGALALAYRERYGTDEEMATWEQWAATAIPHLEPEHQIHLWSAVEGYYVDMADVDEQLWLPEARRIRALIDAIPMTPILKAESLLAAARIYARDDDQQPIAELYRQALDTGALSPRVERAVAVMEARLRMRYNDLDRLVELLLPRYEGYIEEYVTAIREEERDEEGRRCAEASTLLAFALGRLGRWREAVETIEQGKCLRQRFLRALREAPEAAGLLEIEADLYALARGLQPEWKSGVVEQVQDWFASGLSPEAQLRERYRTILPDMQGKFSATIDFSRITAGLREGEAALSLGLAWPGTIAALLVNDRPDPVWTSFDDRTTQVVVIEWLAGSEAEGEGFLLALERGVHEADPRPPLERLLANLDRAIGAPVAEAMRRLGLKRLVVLPHNFLRLAPLWALESWAGLDVRLAPGAFALVDEQSPVVEGRALVVANPTLDLPLAATEALIASAHLESAGLATQLLKGSAATEQALAEALAGSSLLHFAGHGIASLTNGSMSALLASPIWQETPVADALELLALESAPEPPSQLSIDREEGSSRRKLFLEYSRRGTLYAEADGDDVLLAGELWRAGDILVQGTLDGCGLAFLCACSSGLGSIEILEEASGLPAALAVAGVGSVISTGWPVADEITLLFADEFYSRLARTEGTADVVAIVRSSAAALRELGREQAIGRIEALLGSASDHGARFRLKAFAKQLSKGSEHPFSHPFDSGAFYVTGSAAITIEGKKP